MSPLHLAMSSFSSSSVYSWRESHHRMYFRLYSSWWALMSARLPSVRMPNSSISETSPSTLAWCRAFFHGSTSRE